MGYGVEVERSCKKGLIWQSLFARLWNILLLLLMMMAGLSEFVAASPRPFVMTQLLMVPPDSDIGVNYYHESMGYIARSDAGIERDLDAIEQLTDKIKVYHSPYALGLRSPASTLAGVERIVRAAKSRHMYVVWTENDDQVTLTDHSWDDYARRVLADAAQAYQAGADEFLVGNEISLHNNGDPGFSDAKLPERIRALASACRGVFPDRIGYEDGWFKYQTWSLATLGPLDKLYFTLYEPWHTYTSALDAIVARFGSRVELGEVSTAMPKQQLHDDDDDWTRDLLRRYDYARLKHIEIWPFAFRETSDNGYGIFPASSPDTLGAPHVVWDYIRRQRFLTYHNLLNCDFRDPAQHCFVGDGSYVNGSLYASAFNQPLLTDAGRASFVFRGTLIPLETTGSEDWRAMRLVFRYSDPANYYYLDIEPNSQQWQLYRRQDGNDALLQEDHLSDKSKLVFGCAVDFEIRVQGYNQDTSMRIFLNDSNIVDLQDSGNQQVNGTAMGIQNNGISSALSDVFITDFETSFSTD